MKTNPNNKHNHHNHHNNNISTARRAGEMAQGLGDLAHLEEDTGSAPSIHIGTPL